MKGTLLKLGISTVAAVSTLVAIANATQAAVFNYDFSVNTTDLGGPLTGSFSFDSDDLSPAPASGRTTASLLSFEFEDLGAEIDKRFPNFPKVIFEDGEFAGLNLSVDEDMEINGTTVDSFSIFQSTFRYTVPGSETQRASVTYTAVPEPGLILGFVALAGLVPLKRKLA